MKSIIKTYWDKLKIEYENYKPMEKLELYPEYGCYLVDCIRHNF